MGEPRSSRVMVDGRGLHVLEWGPDDAPPVLILHGFSGHAWQAELMAPALVPAYRVIALDQRGHGDSDWADVYGAKPMATDAVGVLDALGIERASLVGHSLGGIVALAVAGSSPERVSRLVLGDIGPEIDPAGAARIQRAVRERDVFASVDDAVAQQAELNPTADPAALAHRIEHNLVERPDGTLTWKYDPALREGTATFDHYAPDEQWALFAAITVPVLILRGELSDILSVEVAERMLAVNPHARLVTLAGAGHSIATDAPDRVAAALVEFLA